LQLQAGSDAEVNATKKAEVQAQAGSGAEIKDEALAEVKAGEKAGDAEAQFADG